MKYQMARMVIGISQTVSSLLFFLPLLLSDLQLLLPFLALRSASNRSLRSFRLMSPEPESISYAIANIYGGKRVS